MKFVRVRHRCTNFTFAGRSLEVRGVVVRVRVWVRVSVWVRGRMRVRVHVRVRVRLTARTRSVGVDAAVNRLVGGARPFPIGAWLRHEL